MTLVAKFGPTANDVHTDAPMKNQDPRMGQDEFDPDATENPDDDMEALIRNLLASIKKDYGECAACHQETAQLSEVGSSGVFMCPDCRAKAEMDTGGTTEGITGVEPETMGLMKAEFTDAPWSKPTGLSDDEYRAVCLIKGKTKADCHFPIRSTPNGPINKGALRAVWGSINGARGGTSFAVPASVKAHVKSLMKQAGIGDGVEKTDWQIETSILKTGEEEQLVTYVVYPAQPVTWSDSQGDWVAPQNIAKMAHDWLEKSQRFDLHHIITDVSKDDVQVVENWIAPVDIQWPLPNGDNKLVTKGSWVQTVHIKSPDLWQRVKNGEFQASSIRGTGKRRPKPSA
jgi:hypothetical protein